MIEIALIYLSVSSVVTASGTSPSQPSYVSGPSGRGTVGLIWSCILTLWPCVWIAIHLNIPNSERTWEYRLLKKLKYAALALLLTEIMLTLMVGQFRAAWTLAKEINAILDERGPDIEMRSGEMPNIGDHNGCPLSSMTSNPKLKRWNLTIAFFTCMGGFKLKLDDEADSDLRTDSIVIPEVMLFVARRGVLPPIDESLCNARAKSDAIGKIFVVGQVSWFIMQCIARKAAGLPITLLEINTAIHVACAIGIYALMWYKPQDATEPIQFDLTHCATCREVFLGRWEYLKTHIANVDDFYLPSGASWPVALSVFSLAVLYGGLHAVAWDAHFPSYPEQIIWRVSVILVVLLTPLVLYGMDFGYSKNLRIRWFAIAIVLRLYLVLEAFISVRSVPVGAYQTVNWVGFLPHIR
jgi:hypothetical protein